MLEAACFILGCVLTYAGHRLWPLLRKQPRRIDGIWEERDDILPLNRGKTRVRQARIVRGNRRNLPFEMED